MYRDIICIEKSRDHGAPSSRVLAGFWLSSSLNHKILNWFLQIFLRGAFVGS